MSFLSSITNALGLTGGGDGGASQTIQNAISAWRRTPQPTANQLKYIIEQYQIDPQILTPTDLQVLQQQVTAFNNVNYDPQSLAAQRQALSDTQSIANNGYTAAELASITNLQNQQMAVDRGNRQAIIQHANAQGVGGSGVSLASQMLNQQAGANSMAQQGLAQDANSKILALRAMNNQFVQGGKLQAGLNAVKSQKAQASDAINKFNTNQENTARTYNLNRAYNAGVARQNISIHNANLQTAQNRQPSAIRQQIFNNANLVNAGAANLAGGKATVQQHTADAKRNALRKLMSTGAAVGLDFMIPGAGGALTAAKLLNKQAGVPVGTTATA